MPREKYKICLEIRITIISKLIFSMFAFNFMAGLIPGISEKSVFAQSTYIENKRVEQNSPNKQKHTITPRPKPEFNMPMRSINSIGSTSPGKKSESIKSTDAGIIPRYQQPSECMDCGIVDFITPGYAADIIAGGIISGVIASKIFRRESHKYHPADTNLGRGAYPNHHFNGGQANHMMSYDIGITMNDGTQTIIKQQTAPHFHSGDRIKLIDGVLKLNN
jgi:hypothetical protein